MLMPGLTRYGLASATSPSGKKYWTLLVGEECWLALSPNSPSKTGVNAPDGGERVASECEPGEGLL